MIGVRHVVIGVGLFLVLGVDAYAQPPLKIGTRVGVGEKPGGYDDGGRRDPFASLIAERPTAVATAEAELVRAKGLAGVAVVDVAIKGIITSGQTLLAIMAGPDGAMYLARPNDRLHDAVVRRIDRDAVIFTARVPDGTGKIVSREVRKGIRPSTGEAR